MALGIRALVASRTQSLFPDGAVELELAQFLMDGNWGDALATRFHPLFAALSAAVASLTGGDLEATALVVSLICSALVAPICALTAAALTPSRSLRAASAAGLLAACHPYLARLGGQVMAYSVAHVCLACAVLASVLAAQRRSWRWAVAAGCAVGLGYTARSDALATGLGLGIGLCVAALAPAAEGDSRRRRLALPLAFLLGTLVCMSPYVAAIRAHSGQWQLSLKKSVASVIAVTEDAPVSAGPPQVELSALLSGSATSDSRTESRPSLPRALVVALRVGASTAFPTLLVLFGLGCVLGRVPRGYALACFAMAVFVLVHGFLKHNWGYTSRIHQSALGVLVVPLAARGMVLLAAGVSSRVGRSEKSVAGILLAIVLVAGPVPKALKPNRGGRALERTVGEWIREDFGSGPLRVFGWESRVPAHYARARFSALPPGDPKSAIEAARRLGGDYVVIHLRSHGPLDEDLLPKLLVAGLKPAHSPFEARRDDVIYTWLVFRCQ